MNEHMYRKNIKAGCSVEIVLKQDQKTGALTTGQVDRILTRKAMHTRGIKVMLKDGRVGRVQHILDNIS